MTTPLQRRFLTVLCLLLSTFCVIAAEISPTGNILYVKKGATGNGSSWTNALGELSEALQWAQANKDAAKWDANNPLKIYVAKGTYTPSINPVDNTPVSAGNKRDATFLLVKDVQLYGGFAGTETTLAARNLSLTGNATILSGDLDGNDGTGFTNNGYNAYHVVISADDVGTATLDGFTLTGGNANASGSITVNTKSIDRNAGGGIYNAVSSPVLTHVSINGNVAYSAGGGIYNNNSSPVLTHVNISANTVTTTGGGMSNNNNSSPVLTNVIISGNKATGTGEGLGGGIANRNSSPVLTNVTISGNSGNYGSGIYNISASNPQIRNSIVFANVIFNTATTPAPIPVISYSLVQGSTDTNNGNMDGSTNPQFVDATNGNYRLQANSPAVNAGNNTYFASTGQTPNLSAITTDIAGNARIQKGNIDLGAYESPYSILLAPDPNGIIYVTTSGAGNKTGDSWVNASNDLQMAINATNVQQVWVAKGTYKPKYPANDMSTADPNNRNNAFVLKKDVQVYGGFAGTETTLAARNLSLSTNASILSGDLGTATNNTDNAYHVVISAGDVGTAELNGFTLTGGNANNSSDYEGITVNSQDIPQNAGGGIYNSFSSPVLTHVSINQNSGNSGGGIYNNNSSPVLTHVSINQNTASGGGGINNEDSNPVLTNVSISSNTAHVIGGGIYNSFSSPVLTNVSISRNTAIGFGGAGGGAMHNNDDSSNPQIRNSIIYDNNTGIVGRGTPVISYSLVQGFTDTNNGNIDGSTDPQFVNAAYGDYSLKSTSPLINKGNNTYFDAGQTPDLSAITTDLAGNLRIQKGKIDLGAYESSYSTPLTPDAKNVIYVTETGNGDFTGNSWANATNDLQMAINATNVQQVWVAGGTYKPMYRADDMSDANANDRNNAFVLKNNVKIYGGFAGTETALTDRDLSKTAHTSILSGDLGTINNNTDNAYHVVISAGAMGTATLNGFTVKGGNANGKDNILVNSKEIYQNAGGGIFNSEYSSPVISNLTISQNTADYGGGMYNSEDSSPVLTNLSISQNTASAGGGIYNDYSSPVLTNLSISSNNATSNGGGIYNGWWSSPVLTNVSISSNTANLGGGIYNISSSSPKIYNSIVWGNTLTDGTTINNIGNENNSSPQYYHSLIQGSGGSTAAWKTSFGIDGGNNIAANPKFTNATAGDYTLANGSPAIDKGNNDYYNNYADNGYGDLANDLDLAGKPRLFGTTIDMGAYESQEVPLSPSANGIIYVTQTGAGDKSGDSWANATNDLQMAINATNVQQVWVAKGTYKPKYRADNMSAANANDRNNAFVLKNNVKIYGGFAGTETSLGDRDLSITANATTLSGDFNGDDAGFTNNGENAYHVVLGVGADENNIIKAEINGFTITGGNASFGGNVNINGQLIWHDMGGGIYNVYSSPVLTHVNIYNNKTTNNGGGMYNKYSSPVLTHVNIYNNTIGNGSGGGIYNDSSSPVLSNVNIHHNIANYDGGGMYNNSSSPVLSNVIIHNNIANYGGGMYNLDSSPILTNVTIRDNTANNNGTGGGINNYTSSPVLTNVTISRNLASNGGGGIYNNSSSSPKIYNSIIWGNTLTDGTTINNIGNANSSIPQFYHSLVQGSGGSTSWNIVFGTNGGNNIDANPMFTNATAGDYTLANTSPAIETGNNAYYTDADKGNRDLANDLDLAGKPRLSGTDIDMGAYEKQTTLPVSLLTFAAKANGNRTKLAWQTAAETNNALFVVYRSSNGTDFIAIDQKAGLGTSATGGNYLLYDNSPLNGTNYYKLVQVDKDSTVTELGIRTVTFNFPLSTFNLYPNPAKNHVNITFTAGSYSTVQLRNIQGQLLQTIKLQENQAELRVSVENLPAGVYYVGLTGEGIKEVKKLVVIK